MRTLRATLFTLFFAIPYFVLGILIIRYFPDNDPFYWILLGLVFLGCIIFILLQWLPEEREDDK